jgi:predicted amidohydrolase
LAKQHRTYIVCPIDRNEGGRRLNTAVLLDRRGQVAGVYDKVYPYGEEFARRPGVQPGQAVPVFTTDFGRLGLAICFDVNWAPLWQRLSDFGAELVIWPSAYSAGRSLQARAIDFNYYVMSATWTPDCLVYDIDGEQLVYDHNNVSDGINTLASRSTWTAASFTRITTCRRSSRTCSRSTERMWNARNGFPWKDGSC